MSFAQGILSVFPLINFHATIDFRCILFIFDSWTIISEPTVFYVYQRHFIQKINVI